MCAKKAVKVSLSLMKLFGKKCRLFFRTRCICYTAKKTGFWKVSKGFLVVHKREPKSRFYGKPL